MDRDPKAKDDDVASAPTVAATQGETLVGTMAESWPTSSGSEASAPPLMRYRLGTVLGRGGMGEVVSAHDDQIGRSVAIKRMRTTSPTPEATARFLREAKIQGRLDHPAVVPVHELWHDAAGQPFFVMKQLTGVTLAELIGGTRHTRQKLLRAFADVCLAVEFAHTRGVVHRDLKPANIVLGEFGEVYVLDWGIARVTGDEAASFADVDVDDTTATVAGSVLGTPGYMSPEQIASDATLDGRADVYALGCILFEILTTTPLHTRGIAGLAEALAGNTVAPSARAPDAEIAPELDAICLAATMFDRADRTATARELGDAVVRFLDGDRDVALRKQLARVELETARQALGRGNRAADRQLAIRAASRALALDPKAREPAELVARLMMEPPTEVPPEVEREIASLDDSMLRNQAGVAAKGTLMYLIFFPFLYWSGLHDLRYLVGGVGVVLALYGLLFLLSKRASPALAWSTFGLNLVVIALMSRVMTPFLVAPGLALIGAVIYAMHSVFRQVWIMCAATAFAVLAPLFAELLGLISRTTTVEGNALVLRSSASLLDPVAIYVGMIVFVIGLITTGIVLARTVSNTRHGIQRDLFLQAWQLRQLVPRDETAAQ